MEVDRKFLILVYMDTKERKCSKCKTVKHLEKDFYRNHRRRYGREYKCKECMDAYGKHYRQRLRNKAKYYVYYLPKEKYYGHTYDLTSRMRKHRGDGNDTEGYYIRKVCASKDEACWWERLYQKKLKSIGTISPAHNYTREHNYIACIKDSKTEVLAKTLMQASKHVGISHERVRQLLENKKTTRKGYSFQYVY